MAPFATSEIQPSVAGMTGPPLNFLPLSLFALYRLFKGIPQLLLSFSLYFFNVKLSILERLQNYK